MGSLDALSLSLTLGVPLRLGCAVPRVIPARQGAEAPICSGSHVHRAALYAHALGAMPIGLQRLVVVRGAVATCT